MKFVLVWPAARVSVPERVVSSLPAVAVPGEVKSRGEEKYIRSYSWVLNWSLAFGVQKWDTIAVLPSVTKPGLDAKDLPRAALARRMVIGQDIGFVERKAGDTSPAQAILLKWFQRQQKEWAAAGK